MTLTAQIFDTMPLPPSSIVFPDLIIAPEDLRPEALTDTILNISFQLAQAGHKQRALAFLHAACDGNPDEPIGYYTQVLPHILDTPRRGELVFVLPPADLPDDACYVSSFDLYYLHPSKTLYPLANYLDAQGHHDLAELARLEPLDPEPDQPDLPLHDAA